jgi:hypothetical protein
MLHLLTLPAALFTTVPGVSKQSLITNELLYKRQGTSRTDTVCSDVRTVWTTVMLTVVD